MNEVIDLREEIARHGFAVLQRMAQAQEILRLRRVFEEVRNSGYAKQQEGSLFAARNLLAVSPAIRSLALSPLFLGIAQKILGEETHPVRSLLFDKTESANWRVPWHQDLTISVRKHRDVEGYGPWSVKSGMPHVQPPQRILESMLTLRLHLDDCHAGNGALRVIPGSHRSGKMYHQMIEQAVSNKAAHLCELSAGDLLLMKPLLLHSSLPAACPDHRRVIHLEYCSADLAEGLEWGENPIL